MAKGPPSLDVLGWAVALAGLGTGIALGNVGMRYVPLRYARWGVVAVSIAGGIATIGRGIAQLA